VLAQLNASLDKLGDRIEESDVVRWFLDPDIVFPRSQNDHNQERLFITTIGAWDARPGPATEIPNMFLAADWLRTSMDFASAEGTNEVSRQCANAILDAAKSKARRAKVNPLRQPLLLAPLRLFDRLLYAAGLPALGYFGATPLTPPPRAR
jgi:hypothetical protein